MERKVGDFTKVYKVVESRDDARREGAWYKEE